MNVFRVVFRFLGSLWLGISLLSLLAMLLAVATFVEAAYGTNSHEFGTEVAKFFVYDTTWFAVLLGLIGVNIAVSTAVRWPWRKKHVPFLVTHCGVLTLLVGCLVSLWYGTEASLSVYEGRVGRFATSSTGQFVGYSEKWLPSETADTQSTAESPSSESTSSISTTTVPMMVPFRPGPFDWQMYQRKNWFAPLWTNDTPLPYRWLLWPVHHFSARTPTHLTLTTRPKTTDNREDVQLEIREFMRYSRQEPAVPMQVSVQYGSPQKETSPEGITDTFSLVLGSSPQESTPQRSGLMTKLMEKVAKTGRYKMKNQVQFVFTMAESSGEVAAFLSAVPQPSIAMNDRYGQVVFWVGGTLYPFSVETLLTRQVETVVDSPSQSSQSPLSLPSFAVVPLGDTGLSVQVERFEPQAMQFFLRIGPTGELMAVSALSPFSNIAANRYGVYGYFWGDAARQLPLDGDERTTELRKIVGQPKMEFLQSVDGRLYYRYGTTDTVFAVGEVPLTTPTGGTSFHSTLTGNDTGSAEFTVAKGTPFEMNITLKQYVPCNESGYRYVSLVQPVTSADGSMAMTQRARVRATVDGNVEEFWIRQTPPLSPLFSSVSEPNPFRSNSADGSTFVFVPGKNRTVAIGWGLESLDLGFGLFLVNFDQRTDPGTGTHSHFSSLVRRIEVDGERSETSSRPMYSLPERFEGFLRNSLGQEVLIQMNRPGSFFDKGTGRPYRIYQMSRQPVPPEHPLFSALLSGGVLPDETVPRKTFFMSTLSVNYDPGRGLKYLGCFLLVIGSAMMIARKPVKL